MQDAADYGFTPIPLNGSFLDGSTFKNGAYKILLRALKVTGSRNVLSDYEYALTHEFVVKINWSVFL